MLQQCLQSILDQTSDLWECIIVDDGSTDGSVSEIRRFAKNYPRIKIYSQEVNRGPSAARNLGVKHASGEYIIFMDSDDKIEPKFIEARILSLRQKSCNSSGFAIYGASAYFNDESVSETKTASQEEIRNLVRSNPFCIESVLLSKDSFLAVGGFDENLKGAEDLDLWFRLSISGIAFLPCLELGNDAVLCRQHLGRVSNDRLHMLYSEIAMRVKWKKLVELTSDKFAIKENYRMLNSRRIRASIYLLLRKDLKRSYIYFMAAKKDMGIAWSLQYFGLNLLGVFLLESKRRFGMLK